MKRTFFARTFGVLSVLVLASCFGDSTGPGELRRAWFSVAPVFDVAALRIVPVDRVHIVLHHNDGSVALDTTVTFPANVDTLDLSLEVQIKGATEALDMDMSMLDAAGNVVFRAPTTSVVATTALGGGPPVAPVLLYVGPGANAVGVRFLTAPAAVFFGQTVTFTAEAFDQNNVTVPNAPLSWSSSDPTRASVPNPDAGQVVAGIARGGVSVTASLLKTSATAAPASATTPLLVQPVANRIIVQAGNNQSGPIGGQLSQPVTARVLAADNLGVFGVTVTFAVTTGGGTVNPVTSVSDASGDAPTIWTLGTALGAQTLTATASGVTGSTANFSASGTVGLPARVAFLQQPTNVGANATMSPAVTVLIQDVAGNTVTTSTASVTLAIGANPGGASLSGGVTVNAVAGVATFNSLTLNNPGTGYTLVATSGGLTNATSTAFNVTGGVPAALAFSVQPSSAVAGVAIAPSIQVAIKDANGITIPTATNTVTLAIAGNPAGGTLSGTVTVAAVAGVATFSGVSIDKAGSGYTLAATSGALTAATSAGFNITPAAATTLAFTTQPPPTLGQGAAFTVVVAARDNFGNTVPSFTGNVTVAIANNPSSGTLGGTKTVAAVAGVATFGNLTIDNTGTGYTLQATAGGLGNATSTAFDVGFAPSFNQWVNPAGGVWSNPANWSKGAVPTGGDTVVIAQPGTYNVTIDQNVTVPVLILGGTGSPSLNQASFTTNVFEDLLVSSGATFNLSGGTLTGGGTGQFVVDGLLNVTGGTVSSSHIQVNVGAELYTTGSVSLAGDTVDVDGSFDVGGATFLGLNSGTLVNVNGSLDFAGGGENISYQFGAAPLLTIAAGADVDVPATVGLNVPLVMNGTMNVTGGSLFLASTVTVGGSMVFSAGTNLNSSGTVTVAAGGSLTGPAALFASQNSFTVAGSYGLTGPVTVSGGSLLFNSAATVPATLDLQSGTIGGTGTLTISHMTWEAGQLGGQGGTLAIPAGADLVLSSATGKSIVAHTVQLGGLLSLASGPAITLGMNSGAQVIVASGGQLDLAGDHVLQYQFGAASLLTVQTGGQLTRSAGTGSLVLDLPVTMNGTMLVNTGNVDWRSTASVTGAVTMGNGTTMLLNGTHTWNTGSAVTGNAEVQVLGGSLTTGGTAYGLTGPLVVQGGTAVLNNSALLSLASVDLVSGVLRGTGQLRVTGSMTWSAGTLGGNSGTLIVPAGAALTLATAGNKDIQNHTVQLAGTMTMTSAATRLGINSSALLEVQSGGLLQPQGDAIIENQFGSAPLLHIQSGGTLAPAGGGNVQLNVPMTVDGAVNFTAGTLNWNNNVVVNGTVTMGATSQLTLNGGFTFASPSNLSGPVGLQVPGGTVTMLGTYGLAGLLNINGGTFNLNSGAGTVVLTQVQLSTGVLNNTSQLNVNAFNWSGGTIGGSNGLLVVSGTLTLSGVSGKSLQAEQLSVTGAVAMSGGTLGVNSGAQMTMGPGSFFDIAGDVIIENQFGAAPLLTVQAGGTMRRNSGTGSLLLNLPMQVDGTFQLFTGNLDWRNNVTVTGGVQLSSGTITNISGNQTWQAGGNVSGNGQLLVSGGTLTSGGTAFGVSGPVRIQGGTLVMNNTTPRSFPSGLDLSSGVLRGTGSISVAGTMNWTGGTIGGDAGTLTIPGGSVLLLSNANVALQTQTLAVGGSFNIVSATTLTLGVNSLAQIDVNAGGIMSVQGDVAIDHQFGPSPLLFIHSGGTLDRSSGASLSLNLPMQMQGAMNVGTGQLAWANSATVDGTIGLAPGTITVISGNIIWSASANVSGPTDLRVVSGGTLTVAGTGAGFGLTGPVRVEGGTAVFNNAAPITLTDAVELDGTLRGTGAVNFGGTFQWFGGTLGDVGQVLTLNAGHTGSMTTAAAKAINGATLNIAGNMGLSSPAFTLGLNNGAHLHLQAGGALVLFDAHTLQTQFGASSEMTLESGSFLSRAGNPGTATIDVQFTDQGGNIAVNAGTLSLTHGGRLFSTASAAAGTALTLGGGDWDVDANWTMTGDFALAGNAAFEHLNGHRAHITGAFTLGGSSRFNMSAGDSLIVNGDVTMNSTTTSSHTGGTLVLGGNLTQANTGAFQGRNHHRTIFNGAALQTISLASPNSRFAVLRPENPATGITFVTDIRVTDTLDLLNMHAPFFGPSGRVILSSSGANPNAASMIDTSVISPIFLAELVLRGQPNQIGNAITTLTIDSGNVAPVGSWNVQDLVISGTGVFDATTPSGDVTVGGDLSVTGAGVFNMGYPTGVDVAGSATFSSSVPNTGLTEGTLTIGGSFTQSGSAQSFVASTNHFTRFTGNPGAKTISFSSPGFGASHFNHVQFQAGGSTYTLQSDIFLENFNLFQGIVTGPHVLTSVGQTVFGGGAGVELSTRVFDTDDGNISNDGLTYNVDTTRYSGSDHSILGGIPFDNVVHIAGTGLVWDGPDIGGSLVISGDLAMDDNSITVGGNFATIGNGVLRTPNGENFTVNGNMNWSGGDETGLFAPGTQFILGGNLVQRNVSTPLSFAAGDAQVRLVGAATQVIDLQTPGSAQSWAGSLRTQNPSIQIVGDAMFGTFSTQGVSPTISGTNRSLELQDINIEAGTSVTFDNMRLSLSNGTPTPFISAHDISFTNMANNSTQLTVFKSAGSTHDFTNLTFDTAPANTVYIQADNSISVFLTSPSPATSSGRVVKNGTSIIRVLPANVDW